MRACLFAFMCLQRFCLNYPHREMEKLDTIQEQHEHESQKSSSQGGSVPSNLDKVGGGQHSAERLSRVDVSRGESSGSGRIVTILVLKPLFLRLRQKRWLRLILFCRLM